MDNNDPNQRSYQQPHYFGRPQGQVPGQQYGSSSAADRFKQPSAAEAARNLQTLSGQGYAHAAQFPTTSMHATPLQYATHFPTGAQGSEAEASAQQMAQYDASLMYVGQQMPQAAGASAQAPQYHRGSGSTDTSSSQYAAYYETPGGQSHQATPTEVSFSSGTFRSISTLQQALPTGYPSATDMMQPSTYDVYGQEQQYGGPVIDRAFAYYQSRVRTIFTRVRDSQLVSVGDLLLDISQYLLGNTEALGLDKDCEALRDDRLKIWDEFNRCWLASLLRQREMTIQMLSAQLPPHQSIMTTETMETLGRELVKLCDNVEKFGLVDYQMGVAEEEILQLLIKCLDLFSSPSGASGQSQGDNRRPER
ncbi:hypothetical protein H2203_000454 [Taxawa tesnikishii (nom. ined.)]|nr:hypothetical protein H2203_000454 [Dothideales sp. JES 119]